MLDQPKDANISFLRLARYAKGRKTLQAILDALYEIVISEGLAAASQEAIAARADVTQSAVRHYFPTKQEMLVAFFSTGVERLQLLLEEKISRVGDDPRAQLLESAAIHYDRMLEIEDVYFFEAAAFWGRNPDLREMRNGWYQKLSRHYAGLIQRMHLDWERERCNAVSFQVLTLILGGWITMGSWRPVQRSRSRKALREILLSGVERLID